MASPIYSLTAARPADYESFIDGDKLIMMLPARVNDSLYANIITELNAAGEDYVRQILLDCSATRLLTEGGLVSFNRLGEFTRRQRIRLMILDAAPGISELLDALLPLATWVDSFQEAGVRQAAG